ncbi:hypothetical protein [Novosphingobium sp. 9]|uniref:hypothetical protein n=1 Tax=Novosphingobium sp. 9 TaxID=2025349 RepID=UPI0021B67DDA|nr:hypothetical protein [Novosphingobium sp. 9]
MAIIIAGGMVLGFGYEFPAYVIHPKVHRPVLLAVHSAVFVSWFVVYCAQVLLIQVRKRRLHMTLGWLGAALALVMPPLGVATALVMRRFDILAFHSTQVANDLAFVATPLADMVIFTPCAWLGIALRKRPDYHRRLMYLATAAIAEAGFGRIPIPGAGTYFYLSNLPLYAAGMIHDKVTTGRVHAVYRWGVPLIVGVEFTSMVLWFAKPVWWVDLARHMTGLS